ncbi:MAG: hypothetical protein U0939_07815 [Pirellulales bacterium]
MSREPRTHQCQPARRRFPGVARIIVMLVLLGSGCGKSPTPTAPAPAKRSPPESTTPTPPPPPPAAPSKLAPQPEPKSETKTEAEPTKEAAVASPAPRQPSSSEAPAVRIALLIGGGPIVIDLQIELDGRPLGASFEEILQHVRQSADADRDGKVTWQELANQRQMREGLLGNPALSDERARLEFVRQHDVNENGLVDEQEWSVVFREQSSRGRPFAVENRDDYRDWNRLHSPLLALLDADGDRALSLRECDDAAARLLRLDADDDERIQTYEASAAQVEIPGMAAQTQRRSSGPYLLWQIGPRTDWRQFIRACQLHYAAGEPLATGCFPKRPRLFSQLDADGNERLSLAEMAEIAKIEPHLRVAIRWGAEASENGAVRATVLSWSEDLGDRTVHCRESAGGLALMQDGSTITLFAVNQAGPSPAARAAMLLSQYDADKNAYLDGQESEMASAAFGVSAAEVDADKDGQITVGEIETYLLSQANATAEQVRALASHPEDALWVHLDVDSDGRLSGDEIAAARNRLKALDLDESGTVAFDEIPEPVWIAVTRGETPAGLVRPVPQMDRADATVPAWFRQMDANGDGHLSRREFLGDDALFQRLDADQDDRLEIQELPAQP